MIKIAVFLALVAVASAGVASVVSLAGPPASTVKLAHHVVAAPAVTYAAAAPVVHQQVVHHQPAVVAAPIAYSAPVTYAAAPQVIAAPPRVIQTFEPVEQHGYKIAY